MRAVRNYTHLDTLVVKLETVLNTTHEDFADFEAVAALLRATLQPTLFVRDVAVDDTITDCLADNVLSILLGVKMQLDADVAERDA